MKTNNTRPTEVYVLGAFFSFYFLMKFLLFALAMTQKTCLSIMLILSSSTHLAVVRKTTMILRTVMNL